VKDTQKTVVELAADPCLKLLSSGTLRPDVGGVLLSTCATDQYSSAILAEMLGMRPRLCQRIDNLCNSGTNSVISGYSLIASGLVDSVLVVGAEKRESPGNHLLWDATRGAFSRPVHWASLFAKSHMRKFGTTEEEIALVAAKNRSNAARN